MSTGIVQQARAHRSAAYADLCFAAWMVVDARGDRVAPCEARRDAAAEHFTRTHRAWRLVDPENANHQCPGGGE